MISNWKVNNFKSAVNLDLDFSRLNIFVGENSSGKSTLIQSILMIAQTLQNPVKSRHIVLNGHIYKFGEFLDILTKGSTPKEGITIEFELHPIDIERANTLYSRPSFWEDKDREKFISVGCAINFSNHKETGELDYSKIDPRIKTSSLFVKYNNTVRKTLFKKSEYNEYERLRMYKIDEKYATEKDLSALKYEIVGGEGIEKDDFRYRVPTKSEFIGAELNHFLPFKLAYTYDHVEEFRNSKFNEILSFFYVPTIISEEGFNKATIDFLIELANYTLTETKKSQDILFVDDIYEKITELSSEFSIKKYHELFEFNLYGDNLRREIGKNQYQIKQLIYPSITEEPRINNTYFYGVGPEFISSYFNSSLKYLGPLRDEPKPIYPLTTSFDPKEVGFKGENTAAVLELNRNELIEYIPSEYFDKNKHDFDFELLKASKQRKTLISAVLDWLNYVGVAANVDTDDKGKLGHELKISAPGSNYLHDLTHVGVGVSQVLPILISSLLAEADSTLIFEQPELHLNPKVQNRLADFFLSMIILDKQCIVETHSEYLINKLRYFMASSEEDVVKNNISIFFVEKEQGISNYKKVEINKYGALDEWPKGFFDESQILASDILKAAIGKRNKEQSKK